MAGTLALAAVSLAAGAAAAMTPAERAARRREAEDKITKVEERLDGTLPSGELAQVQLEAVRRQLILARKLLERRDARAAKVVADQAEQSLVRATQPEALR